jgi:methylenetetrahydrofolate dehydrogenase (NADP+)/methenyltetrahydrofolate cyclohydrolase
VALILDGNKIRDQILEECQPRIQRVVEEARRPPGLAVVLVGGDPASQVYVRNKTTTAGNLGIYGETITPEASITTEGLLRLVRALNLRPEIDGILVQLPLPGHIDSRQVLNAIAPDKDVDGFHPVNAGRLSIGLPGLRPCTPSGVIEVLKRYGIAMAGKHAVVVGRSNIVGKPMAMLLLEENATVTVCHSRTADLPAVCRTADILVAALGRPAAITAEHIRPGAVVIDVGINAVTDRAVAATLGDAKLAAFDKRGTVLVGDVHPVDMANLASAYTPVPGGVGPLTIALLMRNTVDAAECRNGLK